MPQSSENIQKRIDNLRNRRRTAITKTTLIGIVMGTAATTISTYFSGSDDYLVSGLSGATIGGFMGYGSTIFTEDRYLKVLNKIKDKRDEYIVDEFSTGL